MAKGRKNAVSMFAEMGKNRDSTTETVNNINESMNAADTGQQEENTENKPKIGDNKEGKESIHNRELTYTDDSIQDSDEGSNIITEDIELIDPDDPVYDDKEDPYENNLYEHTPKRRGRKPGTADRELQHIHIALPLDVYEKLEIGKKAYYNNKTTYIRNLILNDYEKNREYYEKLPTIR